ncbi:MAG TPA: basic amino acid ABC transporter substrate-binding protein [Acidimicrobiia bacterium]|nr:basic amino acid ABC transporter substrate-binding protein [Acidimicrobiia bacterium]
MRMRNLLAVAAMVSLIAAACGDDEGTTTTAAADLTQTAGVLTVGSDIPWEPFEFYGDDGELTGFDVELVEEIARRLGLEVEWVETAFDTIFTQLATGAFDVVASGATITPERAQQVDFTSAYYRAEQALTINTALTPDIASVDDLADGDRVAVQTGTTGEAWAEENLATRGVEVVSYEEAADTYIALEGGQVQGVIFDEPSAAAETANRPTLAIADVISTNEEYGFGVDPARTALLAAMNQAFADMLADGTYQAIYDKWFPDAPAGSVLYAG